MRCNISKGYRAPQRLLGKKGLMRCRSASCRSLFCDYRVEWVRAPMADLISFQEPHSSRAGEISCQGSRFEKLFCHDLSCCSFKEGHRQSTNMQCSFCWQNSSALDLSFSPPVFLCLMLSAQGGNRRARRARRLSHFAFCAAQLEENRKRAAVSKLDTWRSPDERCKWQAGWKLKTPKKCKRWMRACRRFALLVSGYTLC
jgi:hypothetical protein